MKTKNYYGLSLPSGNSDQFAAIDLFFWLKKIPAETADTESGGRAWRFPRKYIRLVCKDIHHDEGFKYFVPIAPGDGHAVYPVSDSFFSWAKPKWRKVA